MLISANGPESRLSGMSRKIVAETGLDKCAQSCTWSWAPLSGARLQPSLGPKPSALGPHCHSCVSETKGTTPSKAE
jgi:hypothetical protein